MGSARARVARSGTRLVVVGRSRRRGTPGYRVTEQATNSHDFDQVAPLIAQDAVYWFSNGVHEGIGAIRAAFETAWATIADENYDISDVRWIATDDVVAVHLYRFTWSGLVDGQPRSGGGRGTNERTDTSGRLVADGA